MSQHVTLTRCNCAACTTHRANTLRHESQELPFTALKYNLTFPKSKMPEESSGNLDDCFPNPTVATVQYLTYLELDHTDVTVNEYLRICDDIMPEDLQRAIQDDTLAVDFLQRIATLFVSTWHEVMFRHNEKVEWAARECRRFLIHILEFEVIASKVNSVFFSNTLFPDISPIAILESQIMSSIECKETLALLVNLTRMPKTCKKLGEETKCVQNVTLGLSACCKVIHGKEESTHLIVMLFMNLSPHEFFAAFLANGYDGIFMNVFLSRLIAEPVSYEEPLKDVWLLLRNLAMMDAGCQTIMNNLELYLGSLLYPITGPEELSPEESARLPIEVTFLPETKTRVADKAVKRCILDILLQLCREEKNRIVLQEANVFVILKHYHEAEKDQKLIHKIENLLALLRKEGAEIHSDDMLDGMSIHPRLKFVTSRGIRVVGTKPQENNPARPTHPQAASDPEPIPKKPYKIVPEDYDIDPPFTENPCTGEPLSDERSSFNYYQLGRFNHLQKLQFQALRFRQEFVNRVQGCPINPEEPPIKPVKSTENFLVKKFTEVHGPVRLEGPFKDNILKAIKETALDMTDTQADDVEYKLDLLDEDIDCFQDPLLCEHLLATRVRDTFTTEDMIKYQRLQPSESEREPFVIPRPPLNEIRREYFPFKKYPHGAPENGPGSTLKNLHLYDPKIELALKMPYKMFGNLDGELSRMTAARMLQLLNYYPLGITTAVFWEKFQQRYNYIPLVLYRRPQHEVIQFLAEEIYIVSLENDHRLLFSGLLEGVVSPELILKRLWHAVKCLLGENLYYPTDLVMDQIKRKYNFDFDPKNWEFQDAAAFLLFLIKKAGFQDYLTVHRVTYSEDHVVKTRDYVIVNSEEVKEKVADLHKIPKKAVPLGVTKVVKSKGKIPRGYLRETSSIEFVSETLRVGDVVTGELRAIIDPENITVVLQDHVGDALDFIQSLQTDELTSKFVSCRPDPSRLLNGMYVMAFLDLGKVGQSWFRAKILMHDIATEKYLVYTVDSGMTDYVSLENIRYMPRDRIGEVPAFAVPIKLERTDHPSKIKNHPWETDLTDKIFKKYLPRDCYLKLTMVEYDHDNSRGCYKWIVKCDVVLEEGNSFKTLHPDFSTRFMNAFFKGCLKKYKLMKAKRVRKESRRETKSKKTLETK